MAATDSPMLSVKGITRRFGGFTAVDGISFDLPRGAIGGPFGCRSSEKSS